MTRSELIRTSIWALGLGAITTPVALVFASGHTGTMVGAIFASLFLLPSWILWMSVEPWGGSIVGGIAAACAQFAWMFLLVLLAKRIFSRRKQANEPQAR